ncbi:hypothetical protein [Streptomyces leeuwenhoekii]|uniref:Uncharacterized protein n=1 Tax=Streptomyces leeuwenhoekii TaxID=1437453 RepID=A0A0F7W6V4_STRLW|nr:hypothetical protein [Streptomyces leeuwenhoekii]CQR65612.1 Hypothetical Protein sle_61570 [Streptomyces leeuwenhoekii]
MPGTRHKFYRPFLRARQPATSPLTLLTAIGAKVAPTTEMFTRAKFRDVDPTPWYPDYQE